MKKTLLCVLFLFLAACGTKAGPTFKIGLDTLWYPLEISGKENSVLGFSTDLLQEIARTQKLQLILVFKSWDNLLDGLQKNEYEGALSSLRPYNFNEKKYDFSSLYLMTGPVLVVPVNSPINSLTQLSGKEIGYSEGSHQDTLITKVEGVLPRTYRSVPQVLNDVAEGTLDGALVDYLAATSYCNDLYSDVLRIATPPLTDAGLRLLTLDKESQTLMDGFSKGLKEMIENGTYDQLAAKWNLPPFPLE